MNNNCSDERTEWITNSLTPLWSLHHRLYFPLEIDGPSTTGSALEKKRWESGNKGEPSEETESKCFIFIFDGFLLTKPTSQSLDHFSLFQFKNVIRKPSFNHLTLFYVFFVSLSTMKKKQGRRERERERMEGAMVNQTCTSPSKRLLLPFVTSAEQLREPCSF